MQWIGLHKFSYQRRSWLIWNTWELLITISLPQERSSLSLPTSILMHCRRYSSTPIHEKDTAVSGGQLWETQVWHQSLQETRSQGDLFCLWVVPWRICWCRGVCECMATPRGRSKLPCCHVAMLPPSIVYSNVPSKVLQHWACSHVLTLAVWAWLTEKVSHARTIKRCDAAAEQQQYQSSAMGSLWMGVGFILKSYHDPFWLLKIFLCLVLVFSTVDIFPSLARSCQVDQRQPCYGNLVRRRMPHCGTRFWLIVDLDILIIPFNHFLINLIQRTSLGLFSYQQPLDAAAKAKERFWQCGYAHESIPFGLLE